MKRKLSALVLTVFLATSTVTPAFAADNTVDSKGAGITPDSILYPVDRAIEAIQLALTSSDMGKAKLLAGDAEERLAEAQAMLDRNKVELAEKAANDYDAAVEKADDNVQKADDATVSDSANTQDAQKAADLKAKIDAFLADHAALEKNSVKVLSELIEKLPEQAAQKVAANIVKQTLHFEAVKNFVDAKKAYNDQKKVVRDDQKALDDANKAGDDTTAAKAALDTADSKLEDLKTALDTARTDKDNVKDAISKELQTLDLTVNKTAGGNNSKTSAENKIKEKIQNAVDQAKIAFQEQHKLQVKAMIEQKTQDRLQQKAQDKVQQKAQDRTQQKTQDKVQQKTQDRVQQSTQTSSEQKTQDRTQQSTQTNLGQNTQAQIRAQEGKVQQK